MPPRDFLLGEIPAEAIKFNVIFCCPTMFINAVCVLFFNDYLKFHFIVYYFATHIFLTLIEDNKRHLGKKTSARLLELF